MPIADRRLHSGLHPLLDPLMDPLALVLLLVAAVLTWGQLQQRAMRPAHSPRAGTEARVLELKWGLTSYLQENKIIKKKPATPRLSPKDRNNPWNVAVEAVMLEACGEYGEAVKLLELTPEGAFRACWKTAYETVYEATHKTACEAGHGEAYGPEEQDIALVMNGLGNGLASHLLSHNLQAAPPSDHRGHRDHPEGEAWHFSRGAPPPGYWRIIDTYAFKAMAFFFAVFLIVVGAAAGIGIAIWMWLKPKSMPMPMPNPPQFQMSTAFALRACLGWYVAFLLSGTVGAWVESLIPLGAWVLPVAYGFHAVLGVAFICIAEKESPAALWKKISPAGRAWISTGLQCLALALGLAMLLTMAISPFMPNGQPQLELMEFIRANSGLVPFLVIFGTVAVLGPAFEEVFFRGFLLPMMRRGMSPWLAVLLSGALFGAFHLEAQALPVLMLLGCVMGLAFMRSGNIKAAILLHGCWNGGVFLFQRLLL